MAPLRSSALLAVLFVAVACGVAPASPTTSPTTSPAPTVPPSGATTTAPDGPAPTTLPDATNAVWQVHALGPVSPDGPTKLVEHDGDLWVGRTIGDDHQYVVSIIGPDPSRDVELDFHQPVIAGAMESTPVGVVLVLSGVEDFIPYVWLSLDGETWTTGTITDDAFDVAGLIWVDGRFIASGVKRTGDKPGNGPFEAALFESSDGIQWSEVSVDDAFDGDGSVSAPVAAGNRIVVTGQLSDETGTRQAMIESADGGVTWRPATDAGPVPLQVASIGDVLVGAGAYDEATDVESGLVINRSGRWEPVNLDELIGPGRVMFAYLIGQGSDNAVFRVDYELPVEYCYEDPEGCQRPGPLTVSIASDGTIALLDLGAQHAYPSAALTESDGSFQVLSATGADLELRTWPASQGPLPTRPAPTFAEPQGPPLVEWDATVEVGEIYRFPLYTHCGIGVLGRLNGSNWWLREKTSDDFTGNDGFVLGEIHVVAEDQIDYALDGVTVAIYEPRPDEFPGCA